MYIWVVSLHVALIFLFLIQHAAEIYVAFKLREQEEPQGIFGVYSFLPNNNSRNLRITYLLIIATGIAAGFISTWWKDGWMWTGLGLMIVIWGVMYRVGANYLYAVDAITEEALEKKDDPSAIDKFKSNLKARREPEILLVAAALGGLIILWLMMLKPF